MLIQPTRTERLWTKFERTEGGCWTWTSSTKGYTGYGNSFGRLAHRVMYELIIGPIPGGLELDHLCRNRLCVNPAHLEPVTHLENVRRGGNAQKTHCKRGHPLTGEHVRMDPLRGRSCILCERLRRAERTRAERTKRQDERDEKESD